MPPRRSCPRFVTLGAFALIAASSACASRSQVGSLSRAPEPLAPTDEQIRSTLAVDGAYAIARRSVELDGEAPREWVFSATTETGREAPLGFVAWRSGRWTVIGRVRRGLGEQGTFELAAGFGLREPLRTEDGSELVVVELIDAQGAVDPRTISRTLEVFAYRSGQIERVLRCSLGFTVVQGPDRSETEGVQWSLAEPLAPASIALDDSARRVSLRWSDRGWTLPEGPECDVARERM